MKKIQIILSVFVILFSSVKGQTKFFITADRLFDGNEMHSNWGILTEGNKILSVGPKDQLKIPNGTTSINYGDATITPGLIEGHSHLLLYPYNITDWDTQVLKEGIVYKKCNCFWPLLSHS